MTHPSSPLAIAGCAALLAGVVSAAPALPTLRAGDATLDWVGDDRAGYRPRLTNGDTRCDAPAAAALFLLSAGDATLRLDANARTVRATPGGVVASATFATTAGSTVDVDDTWTPDGDAFRLARVVTVRRVAAPDRAFGTGLEFAAPAGLVALADADVFVPGMWYATAAHTPPSSMIADLGQRDFLIREDRMALPIVSLRDRRSGHALTLTHERPDGATVAADDSLDRLVDDRLRFASLGLRREPDGLFLALRFPGTEGEQTRIRGFKPGRPTVERLHPLVASATQRYEATVRPSTAADFPTQLRDAWRGAYARAAPRAVAFDARSVYAASLDVLEHYSYERKTDAFGLVAGVPFNAQLPGGESRDASLQMGFVGQQLPCASYLIDEGLRAARPELVARGEAIADLWVRESVSPAGVPRTWFDVDPAPRWRDYETYLRVVTDGTSGLLRAWQIERAAGRDRPAWLGFCRRVGDWLLAVQNPDGSWPRSWTFDGAPKSRSTTSTLHPVRLLVDLSCATGDPKYRAAAIRAADFALAANAGGGAYVGGTPDNPDVIDKEAGWIAFDSFLALHDVTRDRRYLAAAEAAATFTETWIYAWNPPLPADSTKITIPRLETYAGAASLIATGHSGSDVFLAFASLSYARLALHTGDEHYADVARLLQANTAQLVDVDGRHGYAVRGLLVEAFGLAVDRGGSVRAWLPWGTSAILEPMARSRELFGTLDLAEALKLDDREHRNAAWAKTRGFTAGPALR